MIWTRGCVDFQDELNDNVWRTSPQVQRSIQPPMMGRDGVVGAAQSFVGDQALPWVPDIVGRRWREPGSILLFGSSYADFFSPFAGRTNRMQGTYRATSTWQQFQESFLSAVVDDDRHYYDPIQRLLSDADVALERVVLTDLCRASFVAIHQGRASASESVLRDNDGLFNRYVRGNADWHYQRFEAFRGDVVVALGALATRGVLHLLGDAHSDQGWVRGGTPQKISKVVWRGRELHILCVPHPAAHGQVPSDGAETLRALLNNAPPPPPAVPSVVRPSSATGQPDPVSLWEMALRDAKPLPASVLMAKHPKAEERTRALLEDDVTARRLVAITNAMYNPCRPANLKKRGLPVTAQQAWEIVNKRLDDPHSNQPSKWRPLVEALDPIPAEVANRIRRMSITELGSLAAAIVRGPYRAMEPR